MSGPTLADLVAQLDALVELRKAALPGPWTMDGPDVYDDGGEISIDVGAPAGLLACLPTGVFALTEAEWSEGGATARDARWARAVATDATPTAAFITAAGSFDFAALRAALAESPARSREEPVGPTMPPGYACPLCGEPHMPAVNHTPAELLAWEGKNPTVHVNDGSAHDRAMVWSEGYSAGFNDAARSREEPGLDAQDEATPWTVTEVELLSAWEGAEAALPKPQSASEAFNAPWYVGLVRRGGGTWRALAQPDLIGSVPEEAVDGRGDTPAKAMRALRDRLASRG